jgi:hypothetical protein
MLELERLQGVTSKGRCVQPLGFRRLAALMLSSLALAPVARGQASIPFPPRIVENPDEFSFYPSPSEFGAHFGLVYKTSPNAGIAPDGTCHIAVANPSVDIPVAIGGPQDGSAPLAGLVPPIRYRDQNGQPLESFDMVFYGTKRMSALEQADAINFACGGRCISSIAFQGHAHSDEADKRFMVIALGEGHHPGGLHLGRDDAILGFFGKLNLCSDVGKPCSIRLGGCNLGRYGPAVSGFQTLRRFCSVTASTSTVLNKAESGNGIDCYPSPAGSWQTWSKTP